MTAGATALGAAGCEFNLSDGVFNACAARLPERLRADPLFQAAWRGLDPANVCDVHCHVFGNGDSGSGLWFNPALERIVPLQGYLQRVFYLNASCANEAPGEVDEAWSTGCSISSTKCRRAFARSSSRSTGRVTMLGDPIRSARRFTCRTTTARRSRSAIRSGSRGRLDPSLRSAALDRLDAAAARGARAIKWLPSAQGIDPAVGALRPLLRAPR